MPCYRPLTGYRALSGRTPTGAWPVVFDVKLGIKSTEMKIPCGRCVGCRMEKQRQWGIRCCQEASLYINNCFATLTYDDERSNCEVYSLVPSDLTQFMKNLRKKYGPGIRFFGAGEYGKNLGRPHYHICLFNHDFHDKYYWKKRGDNIAYRSKELEGIWKYGNSELGSLTFESAAYCAKYIGDKVTGEMAEYWYDGRIPEFCRMSRMPGIGKPWLDKYANDIYQQDVCVIRGGIECRPPAYYDRKYDEDKHMEMIEIKHHREERRLRWGDMTDKQRKQMEEMVIYKSRKREEEQTWKSIH